MHRILILSCLLAASALLAAEYEEANHDDGSLHYKIELDGDGKRHGRYTLYHPAGEAGRKGRKAEVGQYRHGQLHGVRTIIDAEGTVLSEQQWRDGVLELPLTKRFLAKRRSELGKEAKAAVAALPKGDGSWQSRRLLTDVLTRVNEYRLVCGLPSRVRYRADFVQLAQCASEVQAALGVMNHLPTENPGLPEDRWLKGKQGSVGNLTTGIIGIEAVDAWMDDSDERNRPRVGHRRWFLCPGLEEMGYGHTGLWATAYVNELNKDAQSGYDIIAFPARGLMPIELFGTEYCWSVSPDPKRYEISGQAAIEIRPYDLRSATAEEAIEIGFASLQNMANSLPPPAIIAQPKGLSLRRGAVYQVTVTGVKPKSEDCAPLQWITMFY